MPPSASENERGGKPFSQAEIAAHLTSLWEAVSTEKNPRPGLLEARLVLTSVKYHGNL